MVFGGIISPIQNRLYCVFYHAKNTCLRRNLLVIVLVHLFKYQVQEIIQNKAKDVSNTSARFISLCTLLNMKCLNFAVQLSLSAMFTKTCEVSLPTCEIG